MTKKNLKSKINPKDIKIKLIESEYLEKYIDIYYRPNKNFKKVGYLKVSLKDSVTKGKNWKFVDIIEEVKSEDKEVCFLELFFIEKEFRSKGIGSYVLELIEKLLKERFYIDVIYVSPFPFENKKRDDTFMLGYEKLLKFYKINGYEFKFCVEDWSWSFPLATLYSKDLNEFNFMKERGFLIDYFSIFKRRKENYEKKYK